MNDNSQIIEHLYRVRSDSDSCWPDIRTNTTAKVEETAREKQIIERLYRVWNDSDNWAEYMRGVIYRAWPNLAQELRALPKPSGNS